MHLGNGDMENTGAATADVPMCADVVFIVTLAESSRIDRIGPASRSLNLTLTLNYQCGPRGPMR